MKTAVILYMFIAVSMGPSPDPTHCCKPSQLTMWFTEYFVNNPGSKTMGKEAFDYIHRKESVFEKGTGISWIIDYAEGKKYKQTETHCSVTDLKPYESTQRFRCLDKNYVLKKTLNVTDETYQIWKSATSRYHTVILTVYAKNCTPVTQYDCFRVEENRKFERVREFYDQKESVDADSFVPSTSCTLK